MVAQSFVWRSTEDSIVLDSVEALSADLPVAELFEAAAQAVVGRMGIASVLVGGSHYGVTKRIARKGAQIKTPEPMFKLGYSDARCGCRVVAVANQDPTRELTPLPASDAVAAQGVNELMEGSDVFCEHCDAEVHPAAEICPACGQDISEWVEEDEWQEAA